MAESSDGNVNRRTTDIMGVAAKAVGSGLSREPGRDPSKGPHELNEFAPALKESLRSALVEAGDTGSSVCLGPEVSIADWNRDESEVDLVVFGKHGIEIAAELKAWDIGHQLFDLAKICCLLKAGASAGFLLCIAHRPHDFDRKPGGELFPARSGERRNLDFEHLISAHLGEWRHHVGKGRPEPTAVPRKVSTIAVADPVEITEYWGHQLRAVEVQIADATPIPLHNGLPPGLGDLPGGRPDPR